MAENELREFTFGEIREAHEIAKKSVPEMSKMSLRDFSRFMNESLDTTAFRQGDAGAVLRTARRANEAVEGLFRPVAEPLGQAVGKATEGIGGLFGEGAGEVSGRVGQAVGGALPRLGVDILTLKSLYTAPIGIADLFLKGYSDTGSVLGGAAHTAAFFAAPAVGRAAASKVAKEVGVPFGQAVRPSIGPRATGVAQRALEKGVEIPVTSAAFVGGDVAARAVSGLPVAEAFTPEALGTALGSDLAFELLGLPSALRGFKVRRPATGRAEVSPVGFRDLFKKEIPGQARSLAEVHEQLARDERVAVEAAVELTREIKKVEKRENVTVARNKPDEVEEPKTFEDAVRVNVKPGQTGKQLLDLIPPEFHDQIPGETVAEKARTLKKGYIDPFVEALTTATTVKKPSVLEEPRPGPVTKKGREPIEQFELPLTSPKVPETAKEGQPPKVPEVPQTSPPAKATAEPSFREKVRGVKGVVGDPQPIIIPGTPNSPRSSVALIFKGDRSVQTEAKLRKLADENRLVLGIREGADAEGLPKGPKTGRSEGRTFYFAFSTEALGRIDDGIFDSVYTPKPKSLEGAKELRKLEAQGAPPEQIARAWEELQKLNRLPGETVEEWAAREAGLPKVVTSPIPAEEVVPQVRAFFANVLRADGHAPEQIPYFVNLATNVAFKLFGQAGQFRLGKPITETSFASVAQGRVGRFIGLTRRREGTLRSKMDTIVRLVETLAHELTHAAQFTYEEALRAGGNPTASQKAYARALGETSKLSPADRVAVIEALSTHVLNLDLKHLGTKEYFQLRRAAYEKEFADGSATEFLADAGALVTLSGAIKVTNKMNDYMHFASDSTREFIRGFLTDGVITLQTLTELFSTVFPSKEQATAAAELVVGMRKLLETDVKVEKLNAEYREVFQRLDADPTSARAPPGVAFTQIQQFHDLYERLKTLEGGLGPSAQNPYTRPVRAVSDVVKELEPEVFPTPPASFGKRFAWFHWFMPFQQLARSFKDVNSLRDAADIAMDFRRIASQNTQNRWVFFQNSAGKFDKDRLTRLAKVGTRINSAFSFIGLAQQAEKKMIVGSELSNRLRKRFPGITDEEISTIDLSLRQLGVGTQTGQVQLIKSHRSDIESGVALVLINRDKTLGWKRAAELGKKIVALKFDTDVRTPDELTLLDQDVIKSIRDEITLDAAFKLTDEGLAQHEEFRKFMLGEDGKGKPWYMPEVRIGEWHLAWKPKGGEPVLVAYKSRKDAEARLQGLNAQAAKGELDYVKAFNKGDKLEVFRGMQRDWIDAYVKADQALFSSITSRLSHENPDTTSTIQQLREEFTPGDGAFRVLASPYMHERRLVGGREELNMIEGVINHVDSTSHSIAKRFVRQQHRLLLQDPELSANPNLRNKVKLFLDNLVSPSGSEFSKVRNFIFFNYLGLNLSSIPVELSQQAITLAPMLVREGATIGGAWGHISNAWKELQGFKLGSFKVNDPELQHFIDRAETAGEFGVGFLSDLYSLEDAAIASKRAIVSGPGKLGETARLASNTAYHTMKFAKDVYGIGTRFNAATSFVAAYRFYRSQGFDPEASNGKALETLRITMFGGGIANRPLVLSKFGGLQGVGGVMYALNGYTFNLLSLMGRLGKEAYANDPGARKAFATMMTTQFMFGGLLGLPMVGAGIALMEQLFPDLELKKDLRKTLHKLISDDDEMGHLLTDGAMSGVFNVIAPVADVGARFQLGNLFGVDSYKGFSTAHLFGPGAGILENWTQGVQLVSQGKPSDAMEKFLPQAFKGAARLLNDGGDLRDQSGKLIFEPTPAESTLLSIGFKPKRLNQFYEQQSLKLRSEQIASRHQRAFLDSLADLLLAGRVQEVKEALAKREQEDDLFDPRESLRRIVEIAQDKTIPIDPSRTGVRSQARERGTIARLFPQVDRPTEVQRLQQRKELERSFGIPGLGFARPQEVRRARLIDELMKMNPTLTRQEAVILLDRQLSRQRPFRLQ
jgi:hypothetical protein